MKIAHLILAHSQPQQLQRLIRKLYNPGADFYLHIDAKTDIKPFMALKNLPHVYFIQKREKVLWGAYSIVQATINGFKEILKSSKQYDYINLLSGQDYPIKSTEYIHRFLADYNGKLFMEFYPVENVWEEAIPRIKKYHLLNYNIPGKYKIENFINAFLPERKMPEGLVAVGRSQWFTITRNAASYIVDYLETHPNVAFFFKLSWAPDEMIFHTILYNSVFRDYMVNNNLRYIDWSEGKPSPKTFTIKDAVVLKNSDKLFARKFNPNVDERIFDEIDLVSETVNTLEWR